MRADAFRFRGCFLARELFDDARLAVEARPFVLVAADRFAGFRAAVFFAVVFFVVRLAGFLAVAFFDVRLAGFLVAFFLVRFAGFLAVVFFVVLFVVRFAGFLALVVFFVDFFGVFLRARALLARVPRAGDRRCLGPEAGTYGGHASASYADSGTEAYSGCSSSTANARRPARHAAMMTAPKP